MYKATLINKPKAFTTFSTRFVSMSGIFASFSTFSVYNELFLTKFRRKAPFATISRYKS